MPDKVTLFVPDAAMIPLEELRELTALDNIGTKINDRGRVYQYRIAWDDVSLLIEVPEPAAEDKRLHDFKHHVVDLLDGRTDKKARKILRRTDRMVKVLECTAAPDWDADRKAQHLVQGIMNHYDYALMLADRTVYNENGNIEVGHHNSQPKYFAVDEISESESSEALKRKRRSLKILKNEDVPYIEHLPVIQDSSQTTIRSEEVVAKRAMALYAVVQRAEEESKERYKERLTQYHIEDAVTPEELAFAESGEPEEYMVLRMSQRMESYWLLLWALGFTKQLSRPRSFCHVTQAKQIIDSRSAHQFLLDASLKSKKELLDAADLHYRYHWAVVDAELYGRKPPAGLEPVVVYERHYALNWLINYRNLEWDHVTTDT